MTPAEIQAEYLRRAGPEVLSALRLAMIDLWKGYWSTRSFIDTSVPGWVHGDDGPSYPCIANMKIFDAAIAAATLPTCTACGKQCLDPSDGRCDSCARRLDASLQDGAEGWRG